MNSRRDFLKNFGLGGLAWTLLPIMNSPLVAFAQDAGKKRQKVFVFIFQRGAMDGLSMVAPIGDPNYQKGRPNIALKKDGEMPALALEDIFYLNPNMQSLMPFWQQGSLAFVHQVGSPSTSRSHFDAQDFMELGTPDDKTTSEGFLNRALILNRTEHDPALKAVSVQSSMPRILQGSYPAISLDSLKDYAIRPGTYSGQAAKGFEEMYQQASDQVLRGVGQEIFDSLKTVKSLQKEKEGTLYPKTPLGKHLKEIATLIKANMGLQVAVTDMGGWDTHVNQGNHKGQLSQRLHELSDAISTFAKDLGPSFQDVCIVTMTEFGRTVKENGNRGTDHGHGSVMMLLGGDVKGKKIYGRYKELAAANLFEGRDMPVTTDFRDVLGEILEHHLGMQEKEKIFPHFKFEEKNRLSILA